MKHIFFFFLSLSAIAQSNITFEQISANGSGCPEGTVTSIVSPDGTSMSLLFDEFKVEVPNYGPYDRGESLYQSHKSCNIAFTTSLPPGRLATAITISLQARGNTMTDAGIQAMFSTILIGHRGLANSTGPQAQVVDRKLWMGRTSIGEDWTADKTITVPLRSVCSTPTNRAIKFELRNHLDAKILAQTTSKSGTVIVDSSDARGMLTFTLSTTSCR